MLVVNTGNCKIDIFATKERAFSVFSNVQDSSTNSFIRLWILKNLKRHSLSFIIFCAIISNSHILPQQMQNEIIL